MFGSIIIEIDPFPAKNMSAIVDTPSAAPVSPRTRITLTDPK
ncbi:hypothetical protein [Sorangium sp. So ce513]